MDDRIEKLLAELSLDEKVSLVTGADMWRTPPVARLGIPQLKVTDGPVGARGGSLGGEVAAASFPCGIALGATWNPALVEAVGEALGQEARSKGCQVLLGPTINLQRHPLGGRHFECYAEDPLLTAQLGVAWIRGVQRQGVGACVKHYVCNDSEFERHTISSDVAPRPLRELYLLPFEHAVKRAGSWSLMGSYNKVNGSYACEHRELLRAVLKGEWGFDGAVISDWYAVQDGPACARGGLDLEMPGPPRHWGPKLAEAVRRGEVPEADVDEAVRRMLRLSLRTGAFENAGAPEPPERAEDRPEHRSLARRAAAESIVLLKNEAGALPLAGGAPIRRLAVIGPNARHTGVQGGGSARVTPHYEVTLLAGIEARAAAAGIEVVHAPGCASHKRLPLPDRAWLSPGLGHGPRAHRGVLERPRRRGRSPRRCAARGASSSPGSAPSRGRSTSARSARASPGSSRPRRAASGRSRSRPRGARACSSTGAWWSTPGKAGCAATPTTTWGAPRSARASSSRPAAATTCRSTTRASRRR